MYLLFALHSDTTGIYIHTRSDGKIYNRSRLRAKTKRRTVIMKDLLFALLAYACKQFTLTISVNKSVVLAQGIDKALEILLNQTPLETVHKLCYLGSTITDTLSLQISTLIGKVDTTFDHLKKRAWDKSQLTITIKVNIYDACILRTPENSEKRGPHTQHKKGQLSFGKLQTHPWYHLAGQNYKQRGPRKGQLTKCHCTV